jgi:hypothetical protein
MHAALAQALVSAGQSREAHDQYVQCLLREWREQPDNIVKLTKLVVQRCQVRGICASKQ